MNIKSDLDKGFFVVTLLNVFFLLGLIFIMKTENLFILIPYAIIMCINAGYLVAKAMKIKNKESDNKKKLK